MPRLLLEVATSEESFSMSQFNVTVFWMGTNDQGKANQRIAVDAGTTVRGALSKAGVPTDNVVVNVNRVKASLDQEVGPNDQISVTPTNLKGAAIDFSEILAWGKGEGKIGDGLVEKALAERAKKGAEQHIAIIDELIDVMQSEATTANAAVAAAEKALAKAQSNAAELAYASAQLSAGNPFSLLGFAGRKHEAAYYCGRMGCAIPASNSPVWATSAPAEK